MNDQNGNKNKNLIYTLETEESPPEYEEFDEEELAKLLSPELKPTPLRTISKEKPKNWKQAAVKFTRLYGRKDTPDSVYESVEPISAFPLEIQEIIEKAESFAMTADGSSERIDFNVESNLALAIQYAREALRGELLAEELREKIFLLKNEIHEFHELVKVHHEEVDAGFYELPYERARNLFNAEMTQAKYQKDVFDRYNWLLNQFFSGRTYSAWTQMYGTATAASSMALTRDEFKKDYQSYSYQIDGKYTNGFKTEMLAEIHQNRNIHKGQASILKSSALQAKYSANGARWASVYRKNAHEKDMKWTKLDAGFRRRRTEISHKYMDTKSASAVADDGALNYRRQLDNAERLISANISRAIWKGVAAIGGLKEIYNIEQTLAFQGKNTAKICANILADLIAAQDKLTKFFHEDQSFAFPVSVRQAVEEYNWFEGLNSRTWRIPESFFAESVLGQLNYCRCTGIAVHVEGMKEFITVKVTPPATAYYRYSADEISSKINQSKIPSALIARTTSRNSERDPDLVAINAFHNLSPLGEWVVEIASKTNKGTPITSEMVKDIEIDFHLAMRSPRSLSLD